MGLLIANEPVNGHLLVLAPIKGGPAEKAGILPGDEVCAGGAGQGGERMWRGGKGLEGMRWWEGGKGGEAGRGGAQLWRGIPPCAYSAQLTLPSPSHHSHITHAVMQSCYKPSCKH